jgi:hypothetical protein
MSAKPTKEAPALRSWDLISEFKAIMSQAYHIHHGNAKSVAIVRHRPYNVALAYEFKGEFWSEHNC